MAEAAERRAPIAPRLVVWAARHGRHDLPWQRPATPYRVWVSEIMLQQTQVATVIPYFERFMARFPELAALADAEIGEVLALWSGLGYYARARNLHAAARSCREAHGGALPATLDGLMTLPGIGRSTAGAILALGFGRRAAILDGNAKRVLARYHAADGSPPALWRLAEEETPQAAVAAYTQAIMDLGATVCTRAAPACTACPLAADCAARGADATRYPAPRPRLPRPLRERRFAWIERDGTLLFEERAPAGIWGGLLCLPELSVTDEIEGWCRERLGLASFANRPLPGFKHEFTHFRLAAQVTAVSVAGEAAREAGRFRWLTPEAALAAALPAPIRSYLVAHSTPADATLTAA